jgi:hypothetical protein
MKRHTRLRKNIRFPLRGAERHDQTYNSSNLSAKNSRHYRRLPRPQKDTFRRAVVARQVPVWKLLPLTY